ncbi:alpha/beta hydrolase [Gordonia desulfuricans]|uniref:Alpha/beta hydrolase n=1 Tax=Gordonia desulfuricans TaxID=89051 RepID=A0A7K3LNQ3_9ACTN|nr:alpha/beta hydrolase [Gordonia desulfuricans]
MSVGAVLAACSTSHSAAENADFSTSAPSIDRTILAARGEVVSSSPGLDSWASVTPAGTRATRIVYRSTSGVDGGATTVSGAVFVPGGDRPAGGWPLIAYAHGTTGISRDCGPSDNAEMFGDIGAVASFVQSGYAVVTTDYQGLGLRTRTAAHPYLEPRTAAHNVIDAVRAARGIEPTIGPNWVVYGASQGGNAAWATAENQASYGVGNLRGAVASVPLLDAGYLVDRAQDGTLTAGQRWLYPILVGGIAQADPSIDPDDHLHGPAAGRLATLTSCSGDRDAVAAQVRSADAATFRADSPAAAQALRTAIARQSLPQTATDVPILALYGSVDDIIPVDVMEVTLGEGCAKGDTVQRVRLEGQGHAANSGALLRDWIHARFAGRPTGGDC